jgi:hypothetical protein
MSHGVDHDRTAVCWCIIMAIICIKHGEGLVCLESSAVPISPEQGSSLFITPAESVVQLLYCGSILKQLSNFNCWSCSLSVTLKKEMYKQG